MTASPNPPVKRADKLQVGDLLVINGWPVEIREIVKKQSSIVAIFSDDLLDWMDWEVSDIVPVIGHVPQDANQYV